MAMVYSADEVYQMGVEIERNGKAFYLAAAARQEDEDVQGGFYSAVMDGQTCSMCMDADLQYNAGTQDNPYMREELPGAPNPECEGGVNRCRCIHVYQFFRETGI